MKKIKKSDALYSVLQYRNVPIILALLLSFCNSYKSVAQVIHKNEDETSIKFIIKNGEEIEHLIFTELRGFSEEDLNPFSETVELKIKGSLNNIYQLILKKENQLIIKQFWLKGKDITLKGSLIDDELEIDTVLNSPFYYYTKEIRNKFNSPLIDKLEIKQLNESLLNEIRKNIDSPFSMELANNFINRNMDQSDDLKLLQQLLANQQQSIKNHILSVHNNLDKIINNRSIKLFDYKFMNSLGQQSQIPIHADSIYIIDFWFTACPPCIADHKIIQEKYKSLSDSGIIVIGISIDYSESEWTSFLEKKQYPWDNYLEIVQNEKILSEDLGISSFPSYLILNGNGKLLHRSISIEKSIAFLQDSNFMK